MIIHSPPTQEHQDRLRNLTHKSSVHQLTNDVKDFAKRAMSLPPEQLTAEQAALSKRIEDMQKSTTRLMKGQGTNALQGTVTKLVELQDYLQVDADHGDSMAAAPRTLEDASND